MRLKAPLVLANPEEARTIASETSARRSDIVNGLPGRNDSSPSFLRRSGLYITRSRRYENVNAEKHRKSLGTRTDTSCTGVDFPSLCYVK